MIIEVTQAVKKFHEDCKSLGQSIMEDQGKVPMTIAILIEDKERGFATGIAPDVGFMYDPDNKGIFMNAMHELITTMKPIAIGIISEAWMIRRSADEAIDFEIPVRHQEDRIEVVMVQIETYRNTSLTMYKIIREDEQVKLQLDEEQSQISKDNVGGLFSELLKVNYESFSKSIEDNLKNNLN
jgi:hypothetical protein